MAVTPENIDHWFLLHPTKDDGQAMAKTCVQSAGKLFALTILESTPPCADQSAAIRKVREAMNTALDAIACEGL